MFGDERLNARRDNADAAYDAQAEPKFPYTVGDEVELTDAEPKSDDRFVVILEIDRGRGHFRGEHEDESDEWFSFDEVVGCGRPRGEG